jgi:KDO2-lipid IV(A) lauroyltransferase
MGRPASCHKALALFTLSSGAPQMVLYNRRFQQPMQFEVGCSGKVDPADLPDSLNDIQALTQWYNQRLEQVIRETPEQYWWVHRRWKEKPRSSRARRQAA